MSCEPAIAYKDKHNQFHWTKEECCAANKEIDRKEYADKMVTVYCKELNKVYKNSMMYHHDCVIRDIYFQLAYAGYDIIKVRDYG